MHADCVLARSSHGDLKWRGVHSDGRAVVKDPTRWIKDPTNRVKDPTHRVKDPTHRVDATTVDLIKPRCFDLHRSSVLKALLRSA